MSAPDLHGGKIREAAAALGLPASEILDFSANVNFLGPTPAVVEAARRAVCEIGWYPLDPRPGCAGPPRSSWTSARTRCCWATGPRS
ncbi:MAG: hypothetical protein M5U22_14345 [Thermoleophilia bacterium]|nr:hypothetical protein [Thermoleophilia bacterium]